MNFYYFIGWSKFYYRCEKSKFIETRLRKFAGQYEVIHENFIEAYRVYLQKNENNSLREEFFQQLEQLKKCDYVTPFEISSLVSELRLEIDPHVLWTLLLRKSYSLTKIKGKFFTPAPLVTLKYF